METKRYRVGFRVIEGPSLADLPLEMLRSRFV